MRTDPLSRSIVKNAVKVRRFKLYRRDNGRVRFIVFEVEKNGGEKFYTAIAPLRVTRVPWLDPPVAQLIKKDDMTKSKIQEAFDQILTAIYQSIRAPLSFKIAVKNEGGRQELFLIYAISARGKTEEEVIRKITKRKNSLEAVLVGKFPQIGLDELRVEDARRFYNPNRCSYIAVGYGIPTRPTTGKVSKEQVETILRTLLHAESAEITINLTPIKPETIEAGIHEVLEVFGTAGSNARGVRSTSFSISVPFSYISGFTRSGEFSRSLMRNYGLSQAVTEGISHTHGISNQTTLTHGLTHSVGRTLSESIAQSQSASHAVTEQHSVTRGHSLGETRGETLTLQETQMMSTYRSIARSIAENYSVASTESWIRQHGVSVAETRTAGESVGVSRQVSHGYGFTQTHSIAEALSRTLQHGVSDTRQFTESSSIAESTARSLTRTVAYGQQWGETTGRTVTTSQQTSLAESITETLTRMLQETIGTATTHGISRTRTHSVNLSEMISRMIQESMSRSVTDATNWARTTSQTTGMTTTVTDGRSVSDYSQMGTLTRSGQYMNYYSSNMSTGRGMSFSGILGLMNAIRSLSDISSFISRARGEMIQPRTDGFNVLAAISDAIENSHAGSALGLLGGGLLAGLLGQALGPLLDRIAGDLATGIALAVLGGRNSISINGEVNLPFLSSGITASKSFSLLDGGTRYSMSTGEAHYNIADASIGRSLLDLISRYTNLGVPGFHSLNAGLNMYVNPVNPNAPPQIVSTQHSTSTSTSTSKTVGESYGGSHAVSVTTGLSKALTTGFTRGVMDSWGLTSSMSETSSRSMSTGVSRALAMGRTLTRSLGLSESLMETLSRMFSMSQSTAMGITDTLTRTRGVSQTQGRTVSMSEALGRTFTETTGIAESQQITKTLSLMRNIIRQFSRTVAESYTEGIGGSVTETRGFMRGVTRTEGLTEGYSRSIGTSQMHSMTTTQSYSVGEKTGETYTRGTTTTHGTATAQTTSDAETFAKALAVAIMTQEAASTATQRANSSVTGVVAGEGIGFATTATTSVGMVPSFGVSTSWQTINPEAIRIANLAAFLYSRYEKMRQEGGWLALITAAAETEEDLEKAMMALASGGGGPIEPINNVADVLYTERPTEPFKVHRVEDEKLAEMLKNYTAAGLTPVLERKGFALERYALTTPLRTEEVTAISHPPRKDFPGIIHVENIPQVFNLTPPPVPKGEKTINVGFIVNTHTGRHTQNMVRIPVSKLTHGLFVGVTGYGKTNAVAHLVRQLSRLGIDVIVIDWKNTWRRYLNYVHDEEKKKVRIFTLMDETAPLKFNPLRPPILLEAGGKPMDPYRWKNFVKSMFAIAYSPFMRSTSIISATIHGLYTSNKVFEHHGEPGFNSYPTMSELLRALKSRIESKRRMDGWASRLEMESIAGILDRLEEYAMPRSKLAEHYGNVRIGFPLEYIFSEKSPFFSEPGSVLIIEGGRVSDAHRQFLLGVIVGGIYEYYNELKKPRGRPLVIVLEEAPRIIFPNLQGLDLGNVRITETPFETMFREGREYNLKLWVISQTISALSTNIVANTPMRAVFRFSETQQQELQILIRILGLDPSWDHRPVTRYIERMEHGRAVFISPYAPKSEFSWPYLIQFPYLGDAPIPSDEEIAEHMRDTIAKMWEIIRNMGTEEETVQEEENSEGLKIIEEAVRKAKKTLREGRAGEAVEKIAQAVLGYLETFENETTKMFKGATKYELLADEAGISEADRDLIKQLHEAVAGRKNFTVEEAEAIIEKTRLMIQNMANRNTENRKNEREEKSGEKQPETKKRETGENGFDEVIEKIKQKLAELSGKQKIENSEIVDVLSELKEKIDPDLIPEIIDCVRIHSLLKNKLIEEDREDAEKCRKTLEKLVEETDIK